MKVAQGCGSCAYGWMDVRSEAGEGHAICRSLAPGVSHLDVAQTCGWLTRPGVGPLHAKLRVTMDVGSVSSRAHAGALAARVRSVCRP
jgi:hypothetical protein